VTAAEVGIVVRGIRCVGSTSGTTALRVRIVGIEVSTLATVGTSGSVEVVIGSANGWRNRRGGPEATVRAYAVLATFFVDENNHPDTYCTGVTQQWCAVNPAWTSLAFTIFVWTSQPADFGSDATAFTQCSRQIGTNAR
jgi:glutamate mutase epsilon subunit